MVVIMPDCTQSLNFCGANLCICSMYWSEDETAQLSVLFAASAVIAYKTAQRAKEREENVQISFVFPHGWQEGFSRSIGQFRLQPADRLVFPNSFLIWVTAGKYILQVIIWPGVLQCASTKGVYHGKGNDITFTVNRSLYMMSFPLLSKGKQDLSKGRWVIRSARGINKKLWHCNRLRCFSFRESRCKRILVFFQFGIKGAIQGNHIEKQQGSAITYVL